MKTVYVVTFNSIGSGGFDWYHNMPDALAAFEREGENEIAFNNELYTVSLFRHRTEETDPEKITQEIDHRYTFSERHEPDEVLTEKGWERT